MKRLVILAVGLTVGLTACGADASNQRDHAQQNVTNICEPHGGGVFFDVQDQNVLVYACNDDDKLHLYAY